MPRFPAYALVAGLLALSAPAVAQIPSGPPDFTAIVHQKMPAVVAILTRQMIEQQAQDGSEDTSLRDLLRRRFGQGGDTAQIRMALGSGFIINRDGYIVTNNHVVENAAEIHVRLNDKSDVPAKLVGRDPSTDVAVLKIDPRPNMDVATWGDSDKIEPGAWTIAIGSPFGLTGTVSVGVLSARSRDIQSGPYDDYLQTDAAINRGNSGGPLFNAAGEVIGVNTAIYSPSGGSVGIGFAIPSRTAQAVADQLIHTGKVERGFIGVRLQELTPAIAKALGRPNANGALVAGVEPGAPAQKAGLSTGDIITGLNGKQVDSAHDVSREVAALHPGQQADLQVVRDGKDRDVLVTVAARTEVGQPQTGLLEAPPEGSKMGLAVGSLSPSIRSRLGLPANESGVLVGRVEQDGLAAQAGIQPGDVIVSVNNKAVDQPSDVAQAWASAQHDKRPLLLGVRRGEQSVFVAVGG
ncbi:protease Do [Alsobacter soli]|uniref:Probable periplasmic serine endoprotease DegP-like n=2 Tax=Alsobacter soli TaxID=2109933 RepID=A0A2T1HLR5_9HYPH|nr:protease Do [Alsobacter soli]